jgi:hypothetical protein
MKLKLVFNPLTGNFDFVTKIIKKDIIAAQLVESNDNPVAGEPCNALLFDEDSILIGDDEVIL